jgi:hypothetical protein
MAIFAQLHGSLDDETQYGEEGLMGLLIYDRAGS